MTTETSEPTQPKRKGLYLLIAGGILLLAIGACGFFAYNRFIDTTTAALNDITNNDQVMETLTAGVEAAVNQADEAVMPVYPEAIPISKPEGTPATDARTFFQTQATPDEVIAWYQSTLETQGFAQADAYQDGDTTVVHFESNSLALDLFTWRIAEGQTGFSLLATANLQRPQESTLDPTGAVDSSTTLQPTPGSVDSSTALQPPTGAVDSSTTLQPTPGAVDSSTALQPPAQTEATDPTLAAPTANAPVSLDITANVPSLKAGTLTRYTYDLTLSTAYTAPITAGVEAVLPAGITLLPDKSPGIRYFPADRTVTYRAALTPQQPTHLIKLVVVTDQFIKPAELRLKAYLTVGDSPPTLAVNQLIIAK